MNAKAWLAPSNEKSAVCLDKGLNDSFCVRLIIRSFWFLEIWMYLVRGVIV